VNVYPFIEAERAEQRNVKCACALLEVSRAAFYDWARHVPSRRQRRDDELLEKIKFVHTESGSSSVPMLLGILGWGRSLVAESTSVLVVRFRRLSPGEALQGPSAASRRAARLRAELPLRQPRTQRYRREASGRCPVGPTTPNRVGRGRVGVPTSCGA
jgi:hypothetical protein